MNDLFFFRRASKIADGQLAHRFHSRLPTTDVEPGRERRFVTVSSGRWGEAARRARQNRGLVRRADAVEECGRSRGRNRHGL